MLYFYHGNDTNKVADRTNAMVAIMRNKQPDASLYVFEDEIADIGALDELLDSRGLFFEKHLVVLRGVCEGKESRELIFERLARIAESPHMFVLAECGLHPAHVKTVTTHAEKVEEHSKPKEGRPVFDQHGLVSALKARNKRGLWEGYTRARRGKETPEAICGLLHWGVRDMLQQPDRYSSVYTREQLRTLSRSLIEVYHESHRGVSSLDEALERWALTL